MPETNNYRDDSIHGELKTRLRDKGLREDHADKVLEQLMANPASETMQGHWNDRVLSRSQISALWTDAQSEAILWMDRENPNHWARSMFTGEAIEAGERGVSIHSLRSINAPCPRG